VPAAEGRIEAAMLAGTWSGDRGVDSVRITKDGKGVATLSSGITMKLKVGVEAGRFIVAQDQPNSPLFYSSPNYSSDVAKDISRKARPVRWVFALSADRALLSGIKETVSVTGSPSGEYVVDNTFVREATWTRLYQ
jgi:hypothetical protein